MAKEIKKKCPSCGKTKLFRKDQKTCGCSRAADNERQEVKGNTWEISLPRTPIHTLEQLIEHCQVDTELWEVERWVCNKWEVGAKDSKEEVHVTPLFQVKAFLRRRVSVQKARDEITSMKADAAVWAPKYPKIVRKTDVSENMGELNLTDHHFGKLAWSKETGGWGDYDLNLANKAWDEGTDALLSRVAHQNMDKIVLVVGNDLLHVDNQAGTTTSGTQLSTDTRFQKIYQSVRQAIVRSIDKMTPIAPVKVIVMPGNHDKNASFCIGDSLQCWYRNSKDVEIDNGPAFRKYMQWGQVMLMWTHGNEGKRSDYPNLMAVEAPKMWGSTRFREAHTGDKHQLRVEEYHGVRVRILPTLCPPDEWHSGKGFVGNLRSSEAFVWNKQEGMILSAVYNSPEQLREDY